MVTIKALLKLGQVVMEGDLSSVTGWLDRFRWAEATINVYCREGVIRANAVCGMESADAFGKHRHSA